MADEPKKEEGTDGTPAKEEAPPEGKKAEEETPGEGPNLLSPEDNPDADPETIAKEGEKPDFLPDEAWDEDKKKVKVDVLQEEFKKSLEMAKGLRQKLSKGDQKPPKKAEDYALPTFKDDDPLKETLKDDPFIGFFKGVAKDEGLSQAQFEGVIAKSLPWLAENEEKISKGEHLTDEQKEVLQEEFKQKVYAKIGTNAPRIVRAVTEWGRQLEARGILSEDERHALSSLGSSAEGIKALNKLRTLVSGGDDIPVDTGMDDGLPSDKEILARFGTKEYLAGDAAELAEVGRLMEQRVKAGRPKFLQT